jgi:hypothetical protein
MQVGAVNISPRSILRPVDLIGSPLSCGAAQLHMRGALKKKLNLKISSAVVGDSPGLRA